MPTRTFPTNDNFGPAHRKQKGTSLWVTISRLQSAVGYMEVNPETSDREIELQSHKNR